MGSALLESAGMIVEKKTLLKEHAMEFCSSVSLFAMLFSTPLWFFARADLVPLGAVGWIFLASIAYALTMLFFAKALRHMAISYTTPFLAFGPLVTAILAFLFLGERLNMVQWLGVAVILLGAYLLYSHSHKDLLEPFKKAHKLPHMKYVWLGILFYAITGILDKKIVGASELAVPVISYLTIMFFFIGVIFIVMMLLFHDGFHGIGNGMRNNTKWLSSVAILTIGFKIMVMYAIATPGVLLSLVIPIKKLSALFSTIIGGELFHEDHLLRKTAAALIMIIGAAILVL
ncbi:EamA family transporter [Candidatus Woesearchaeota archaeon]|nr:EamA family transporter [Candidatus Woesearchaeota archaeon]